MAWWAASTAVWSRLGGATAPPAPPEPLRNPVDSLVAEANFKGELILETAEAHYRIYRNGAGNWRLQYQPKSKPERGWTAREFHVIDNDGTSNRLAVLIAALISEDSFICDLNKQGGRKLFLMGCGSGVYQLPDPDFTVRGV